MFSPRLGWQRESQDKGRKVSHFLESFLLSLRSSRPPGTQEATVSTRKEAAFVNTGKNAEQVAYLWSPQSWDKVYLQVLKRRVAEKESVKLNWNQNQKIVNALIRSVTLYTRQWSALGWWRGILEVQSILLAEQFQLGWSEGSCLELSLDKY